MEKTMVKQSTPPPQNPPPPPPAAAPAHPGSVNWNAPVTRGEFQQRIGVLEKNLGRDINNLDKKLSQDINALDKRLVVVETRIEVLDEKVEEVKTDVKALSTKVDENHDTLRAEQRADIKSLRESMEADRRFLTRLILGSVGVLAALMAVLRLFV